MAFEPFKSVGEEGYVELKEFVGRKPQTSYRATVAGRKAFEDPQSIGSANKELN
ncbi:MAG: transcriptional regulator [Saprospiraceae bacterium]